MMVIIIMTVTWQQCLGEQSENSWDGIQSIYITSEWKMSASETQFLFKVWTFLQCALAAEN